VTVKTVLIVEDDSVQQASLAEACQAAGLHVLVAGDGEAALLACKQRLPDVVLCDLLLPKLDGFEVLKELRRMPGGRALPAFVMSGIYRGQKHRDMALETLGCLAWFAKPVPLAHVVTTLCQAVDVKPPRAPHARAPLPTREPLADKAAQQERRHVEAAVAPRAIATNKAPPVAQSGHLERTPIATLLAQIAREQATGQLLLRRERTKKVLSFAHGVPVFAKSNLLSECLGRILVKNQVIRAADCERSLELQATLKQPQGQVLMHMGVLTAHQLRQALRTQLLEKVLQVFSWEGGEFEWMPGDIDPTRVAIDMSVATLIYEGVRLHAPPASMASALEPLLSRNLALSKAAWLPVADLALDADERAMLQQLDGQRNGNEVMTTSKLPLPHARALLLTLAHLRAVEAVQPSQTPPPRPTRPAMSTRHAAVRADVDSLRQTLQARLRVAIHADPFVALQTARKTSLRDVHRCFDAEHAWWSEAALRARVTGTLPSDVLALAAQLRTALEVAYDAVGHEESFVAHQQQHALPRGSKDPAHGLLRAHAWSLQGQHALAEQRIHDAVQCFSQALTEEASSEHEAWLGHALWLDNPTDKMARAQALQRLQHAVGAQPRSDVPWLLYGRALADEGRLADAADAYAHAAAWNPDAREAIAFLRRQPASKRPPARA
jgi:CheY-like chemotaxis protein